MRLCFTYIYRDCVGEFARRIGIGPVCGESEPSEIVGWFVRNLWRPEKGFSSDLLGSRQIGQVALDRSPTGDDRGKR